MNNKNALQIIIGGLLCVLLSVLICQVGIIAKNSYKTEEVKESTELEVKDKEKVESKDETVEETSEKTSEKENIIVNNDLLQDVYKANVNEYLSLRRTPSFDAFTVARLLPETEMIILDESIAPMVKVRILGGCFNKSIGYVAKEYIIRTDKKVEKEKVPVVDEYRSYTVSGVEGYMSIRDMENLDYGKEVGRLQNGDIVVLVQDSMDTNISYVYVPENNVMGYVNNNYLVKS